MCGIAGILSKEANHSYRLKDALDCLRHRGPEAEGFWKNENDSVTLGHRRLSIIDLGAEAAQPMHFLDRYVIVHNGEIYNYIELKKELEQKCYSFISHSDTEVIIAAYDAFGKECVQHFDGMFAFAIWDKKEAKLFAARDRFGEKPFYFYYQDGQLIFGSEIKLFWKLGIQKVVNSAMVYNFITIGYTGNPTDPCETFFEGIEKLPAASFLTYTLTDKKLSIEKYWQVFPELDTEISEDNAREKFVELFSDSIHKRLRSDVAIGTSLSGGLDSSAIVAFCAKESRNMYSHKCFNAGFNGFDKDESKYAKKVADKFNLEQYIIEMDGSGMVGLMNDVMLYQEEPITSASVLAQYKVFELAKSHGVTVLLDGQGADEVLGGYYKYYKWYWQELYKKNKLKNTGELKAAKELGIAERFSMNNKAAALFPDFAAAMLQSSKLKSAFQQRDLQKDFAHSNKNNLYYSMPSSLDLNGALYFNTFIYGLEELLRYADRNSMAHSTEVRLPFLSHELVRYLFNLPSHLKIKNGWTKWILRKAVEEQLPGEIVWRRDKVGFEPPQKQWMEHIEVKEAIAAAKIKLVDNGILNAHALDKKVKPHSAYAAHTEDWKYWSVSYLF